MASRSFQEKVLGLEKQRVDLFAVITFGAAGAPTLTRGRTRGIQSVVRNSLGLYTLTLSDAYSALLYGNISVIQASGSPFGALITSVSPATRVITFRIVDNIATGNLNDPTSGIQIVVQLSLANGNL